MFLMRSDWKVETEEKVPMKENCHKTNCAFFLSINVHFCLQKKYSFYRNAKCRTMPFYCLVYIMFWQSKKQHCQLGWWWQKDDLKEYTYTYICMHMYICAYMHIYIHIYSISYNPTCPSSLVAVYLRHWPCHPASLALEHRSSFCSWQNIGSDRPTVSIHASVCLCPLSKVAVLNSSDRSQADSLGSSERLRHQQPSPCYLVSATTPAPPRPPARSSPPAIVVFSLRLYHLLLLSWRASRSPSLTAEIKPPLLLPLGFRSYSRNTNCVMYYIYFWNWKQPTPKHVYYLIISPSLTSNNGKEWIRFSKREP